MTLLNDRALAIADDLEARAEALRLQVSRVGGARIIDCGGAVTGSLEAGLQLARICLGGAAEVTVAPTAIPELPFPSIEVRSDDPVRACLGSQYAGRALSFGDFSGICSGPIRAVWGGEPLLKDIGVQESASHVVGVIETSRHPTEDVIVGMVAKLPTSVEKITLLTAPPTSLAGTIQVVARSMETALHKLHTLKFDLSTVVSAYGTAPLPPTTPGQVASFGRVNDAILYGARVVLWVRCEEEAIDAVGEKIPSCGSRDYGIPFAEIFTKYDRDFYKIDPLLFSPSEVVFVNMRTGRARLFGKPDVSLLRRSFFGA